MPELHVTTLHGTDTVLDAATVQGLQNSLRGALIRPGDADYDEARKVWNGHVDKRPALIARCAGTADVISAVNFARRHEVLLSVRGGGHNIPGNCVCNGGLVLDLGRMKGIRVDPLRRTARAEGGVRWGELDHETQAFGLATPGGTDADTGIAGLTLGGGIGWLSGRYGLACDNLIAADIVTADGQLRHVSSTEHADLLWGLRGGGGNFGVVTSFEYQLHPVGPLVLAGAVFYPFAKIKDYLQLYRDFSRQIPDELNTIAGLATSPEGHKVGVMVLCYSGPLENGAAVLRPLREFGPPLADHIQPMPYAAAQRLLADLGPAGRNYYIKSHFMQDISPAAIDTMVAHFERVTSPLSSMIFQQMGNAASRVPNDATAFGHRGGGYEWATITAWVEPGDAARHIQWTRAFAQAMQPFAQGVYVNQVGTEADEGAEVIRSAFGANYERLVALKRQYDPTNLFRHNQNIAPTA
ncbi:MAG: FAD-binding oxidoreductase [Candidatus Tectimicrobiota bacterium]